MQRIFILCFWLIGFTCNAQSFKPFKLNLAVGYANPQGDQGKGGLVYSIEPRYGFSDQFELGLRLERAFLAQSITSASQATQADFKAITSGILTTTYFLGTSQIRPFIGLGTGLYQLDATRVTINGSSGGTTTSESYPVERAIQVGLMGRAGLKLNHLLLLVEYNALTPTNWQVSTQVLERRNSFLSAKLSVDLGGGLRR